MYTGIPILYRNISSPLKTAYDPQIMVTDSQFVFLVNNTRINEKTQRNT